jgi:tetratricopeptide (TPR) repeat protein
MQAPRNKYIIFIFLAVGFYASNTLIFAQSNRLNLADSLFTIGKYSQAYKIYQKKIENDRTYNPNLLLKLAFLSEKAKQPAESLYYLSILAQKEPNVALLEKMNQIAQANNLQGYQFNDFSYFLIFYRRYGGYIPILLLSLGVYVVAVMIIKLKSGERIQKRHKWATVFYLTALFGLLNIPNNYTTGVIRSEFSFIRSFPSAAAPVVQVIQRGHKLTIIGTRDHWNRVIWEGKIVYIKKSDLWII